MAEYVKIDKQILKDVADAIREHKKTSNLFKPIDFAEIINNKDDKKVDISFIPSTALEPTIGYIIPESFDINMGTERDPNIKHLSGFWISKYEVQDVPVAE